MTAEQARFRRPTLRPPTQTCRSEVVGRPAAKRPKQRSAVIYEPEPHDARTGAGRRPRRGAVSRLGRSGGRPGLARRVGQHHLSARRRPRRAASHCQQLRRPSREGAPVAARPRSASAVAHPRAGGPGTAERRVPVGVVDLPVDRRRSCERRADHEPHRVRRGPRAVPAPAPYDRHPPRASAGQAQLLPRRPLAVYDGQARSSIELLGDEINARAATASWNAALASGWDGTPVWVHGDVAASNLLVADGKLEL